VEQNLEQNIPLVSIIFGFFILFVATKFSCNKLRERARPKKVSEALGPR
jgi:hypothetical protein